MMAKTIAAILDLDRSSAYPVLYEMIEAGELGHALKDGYRLIVCRAASNGSHHLKLLIEQLRA